MFHTFFDRTGELSLTPCFSWVFGRYDDQNRFNGLLHGVETVETVPTVTCPFFTQLKQGVNEKAVESRWEVCEFSGLELLDSLMLILPDGKVASNISTVKLLLENLPPSLQGQRETLARCLEVMHAALPLRQVILFGSHARSEARPDSDVDLCLVSDGAERQLAAAEKWRGAMRQVLGKPSFTLIPITPVRLGEKRACGDFFFATVFKEGIPLATEDWML